MRYKTLRIFKTFPRKEIVGISATEFESKEAEFQNKFNASDKLIDVRTEDNILQYVLYDTRVGPFDMYEIGFTYASRTMIISNKLKELIKEFKIPNHTIFNNITYSFKGEIRKDMNLMVFAENYVNCINYEESCYQILDRGYLFNFDENGRVDPKYIVEENITGLTKREYEKIRGRLNEKKKEMLFFKYLVCPEPLEYDIFYMDLDIYVSPELVSEIKKRKIKGVKYSGQLLPELVKSKEEWMAKVYT